MNSPDSLLGLALLGKTAFAFALVVASILFCGWLAKRLGPQRVRPGQHLRLVSSTSLGQRERVVIVQVQDKWLVLGVTAQQVSALSELPAPALPEPAQPLPPRFADRLATALKQRLQHDRDAS
ncbi:MAG: flagellar biosynthetic protein FliO [Pseudomonas sp.]|uniref:flagellar biosynthetic protein FliO n=1 Tax=Pseudomonas abieticivorans TaxID=2931382 RepID=UPI0020C0289A|nr:flagellar biosynthetic protein FliO [Pseudomonas sp. PIA16]MDE1168400.1 flagellar biosynthetic protein FliO [Pseudomonas sp.]